MADRDLADTIEELRRELLAVRCEALGSSAGAHSFASFLVALVASIHGSALFGSLGILAALGFWWLEWSYEREARKLRALNGQASPSLWSMLNAWRRERKGRANA